MFEYSLSHGIAALLLCSAAACTDFRTGRIPNRLTLTGLGLGPVLATVDNGAGGLLASVLGAMITALVPLLLFRFRAMGGGDVKLFAALGAIVGAGPGIEIQMTAFVIGALQGMAIWLKAGRLRQGLGQAARLVVPPVFFKGRTDAGAIAAKKTEIRFGPAVLAAAVLIIAGKLLESF